jgi:hypothetical protein
MQLPFTAADIVAALASSKRIVLYSLQPGEAGARSDDGACLGLCYFGWPVLGHTELSLSSGFARRIAAWLKQPESKESTLCFNPRHGVHVVTKNHVLDFVVCFECAGVEIYVDAKSVQVNPIPINSEKDWDRLLRRAGVRLAAPETLE